MRAYVIDFLCLVVFATFGHADERFEQGNARFESGDYQGAIESYESLLSRDGPRSSVLNNLGSAYFRLGDFGRAILAFERALILDPRDPDLRANLELAQEQAAVFPAAPPKGLDGMLSGWSPNTRAGLALLAAGLFPLLAWLGFKLRGNWKWVGPLLILAAGVIVLMLRSLDHEIDPSTRAVVVAKSASVRLSPFETADTKGTLTGGREVRVGSVNNGYVWVEANEGATAGWVREEALARIVPPRMDGES